MTENTFKREINHAEIMEKIETEKNVYWHYYGLGIRRQYHGENFNSEKHETLMNMNDERGNGYRDGISFKETRGGNHGGGRKPTGKKKQFDSTTISGSPEEIKALRKAAEEANKSISRFVLDSLLHIEKQVVRKE